MKIALVIEHLDPARGGREISTAQIAADLARRGQEVAVICQTANWSYPGVELCRLGSKGRLRIQRLRNFIADAQQLMARRKWDIVQSTLPLPGANVYQPRGGSVPAQVASRIRRRSWPRKLWVRFNELLKARRRIIRSLERQVVDDPSVLILAVSEMVAREFEDYYHRTKLVKVIYNGVDVPQITAQQRRQWREQQRGRLDMGGEELLLLTVANNFALKGLAETITALARWYRSPGRQVEARLVVVGGDKPQAYERQARRLGIGGRAVFVGAADEVFSWYAAADACILLSWYDPASRVILEAVRWALPCLTSAYNGAAEILRSGRGIVVDSPKNTQAMMQALDRLADPQSRAAMAKHCSQVGNRLSIEHHVEQLLEAYAEIL